MKLKELLHGLDVLELHADETLDITGVHYDSRQVMRGGLFVAISGFQTDGHKYIPKAAENGAACIVCEKKPEMQIPYVLVSDARAALAVLGANWFGHPADDMCVIGITGNAESWLAKESDALLLAHVDEEGGPLNRAPRNSVLAEMFVLQALSAILQADVAQTPAQYVRRHPGGALGKIRDNER